MCEKINLLQEFGAMGFCHMNNGLELGAEFWEAKKMRVSNVGFSSESQHRRSLLGGNGGSTAKGLEPYKDLLWEVGRSVSPEKKPESWISAVVPGAVQLDWARAEGWPSHTVGLEAEKYPGLEDFWWTYRAEVPMSESEAGFEKWFVVEDVDHSARVLLDGRLLGVVGGVGCRHEFLLPVGCGGSLLEVVVEPAPKVPGMQGRDRAKMSTKAAVAYGWDFHPDLIPLGISGGAWIEDRPVAHIAGVRLSPRWESARDCGVVEAVVSVRGAGRLAARLLDPEGNVAWEHTGEVDAGEVHWKAEVSNPRLWWPRGQGGQPLYTFQAELTADGQSASSQWLGRCGFRRVKLVMAPGQWAEPCGTPASRNRPPMTLEVNGRPVFMMGANVVNPDIFRGTVDSARWRGLVERAAAAGMNAFRLWGGAAAPHDAFYDACDELGILLIQEFPLACNEYPDDPDYLAELDVAARNLISRLAPRPCLGVWSGGNELLNSWSRMTDQSHALRLLGSLCWQLDPMTPFLPAMPIEGVGHGSYVFLPPDNVECFAAFQKSDRTGYTEFGVASPAPLETFREVLAGSPEWPPRTDGVWALHHAYGAWDVLPPTWLCDNLVSRYWGEQPDLETFVEKAHWLSCEGLRGMVEEARRQKPRCGWALIWCFNEPWPALANNSLIAWPDQPKPSYHEVSRAMRPTLASARVGKFQWRGGEVFEAALWMLHDAPVPRSALRVEAVVSSGGWSSAPLIWECPSAAAGENIPGPTVRVRLPASLGEEVILELRCSDATLNSRYRFAVARAASAAESNRPRTLNA